MVPISSRKGVDLPDLSVAAMNNQTAFVLFSDGLPKLYCVLLVGKLLCEALISSSCHHPALRLRHYVQGFYHSPNLRPLKFATFRWSL